MVRPVHEKIAKLLKERGFKKKELAEALGVSLQGLAEILKGRSQVTVSHLKALVKFFGIKAEYWIDDGKDDPTPSDMITDHAGPSEESLRKHGVTIPDARMDFREKIQKFILQHPEEWTAQFGPLTQEEMELLSEMDLEGPEKEE